MDTLSREGEERERHEIKEEGEEGEERERGEKEGEGRERGEKEGEATVRSSWSMFWGNNRRCSYNDSSHTATPDSQSQRSTPHTTMATTATPSPLLTSLGARWPSLPWCCGDSQVNRAASKSPGPNPVARSSQYNRT